MYRIGLDVGIKSVGWCVMECDANGEPLHIKALNTRIFDAAEQPKTGESLALPRRTARGQRRRTRRKSSRLKSIRDLFSANGIAIFDETADGCVLPKKEYVNIDVHKKRAEALDKPVTKEEFARILYSLARHRGFKSNKKPGAKTAEDGKLLAAINENERKMQEKGLRTVGELLYREFEEKGLAVHNKGGDYSRCISRDSLIKEIKLLFEKQKEYGNGFATEENLEKYLGYFSKQRTFDEGPGPGSKYSGGHEVKKCQFYKNEYCAAKGTYSCELSTACQKLNNLTLVIGGDRRLLTDEERKTVLLLAEKKDALTYKDVRKALGYVGNEDMRFGSLNYASAAKKKKDGAITDDSDIFKCESAKFISLKNSNAIRKTLPDELKNDIELIDEIAEICTKYTNETLFRNAVKESGIINGRLKDDTVDELLSLDMKGYGHLSLKALREILPYLKAGDVYSVACEKAGHNHSVSEHERAKYLGKNPEVREILDDITSPVVRRAMSQTIKVIDALIREYGSPCAVNIELARDMSLNFSDRKKEERDNAERAKVNEEIRKSIAAAGAVPNATNVLKRKLYDEQDCKCAYSGKTLDINRLYEDGYYEIDHIIPYSRSFNDSFNNKVLVLKSENQNKRNNTPYEYFLRTGRDWEDFSARVKAIYQKRNNKKMELLLKTTVNEDEWKSRAINDTRYASRLLANVIKDYLLFDENAKGKKRVLTVKGGITSYLRKFWGIQKVRSDGDKHHAVDAAVIACYNDKIGHSIERYNQIKESNKIGNGAYMLKDGEIVSSEYYDKNNNLILPYPYNNFKDELIARTEDSPVIMENALRRIGMPEDYIHNAAPFIVSRMTHRKAKGAIHEATVWSSKYVVNENPKIHDGEKIIVKRTPVENLSLDEKGEIKGYFNPDGDRLLYEAIKTRLKEHGGKGKDAFAVPLRKPCYNGEGNIVRTVKTFERYFGGGVMLEKNRGIAANGSMIRMDLYSKDGKYYGVPVYTADLYKGELPKRAATTGKSKNEWRVMDDTYTFEASIYPSDLLHIENDKEIVMQKIRPDDKSVKADTKKFTDEYVYFIGYDISGGTIGLEDSTGCYKTRKGLQGIKKITKCEIDVLGNITEIKKRPKAPEPLKLLTESERKEKKKFK